MDNLSQEEIDALLEEAADEIDESAESDPGSESSAAAAGGATGEVFVDDGGAGRGPARSFDFHRPNNNLSKGFEKNVRGVSESFAKDASLAFSNLMRATCEFTFGGIRVHSFGESLSSWENPSCIAACSMEPLQGLVLMHVDAPLMFSFFTKLLGGPIEEPSQVRDFTEIETGLARKVLQKVLELFGVATGKVVRVAPLLIQIENNPNYLNAFSDGEAVLNLQFNVSMEEVSGVMSFVVPLVAFEPVREQFDPREGIDMRNPSERAAEKARARRLVGATEVTLAATFRPRQLTMAELLALQPGDVLELGHHVDRPLDVAVEGYGLFEGLSGRIGRNRAIRILGRKEEI